MKNEKVILVTEKSSHEFNVVDKKNYILEGIFAVFGEENVNHRIYEEDEYMPHLEYLQEKIKRNKLAGELDHPEKFDVSLANISHLVEKLWYDKDTRTLRGRIRILDTDPAGLNARKLIDAGFPISISSRAAGVVKENKRVQIKRVFTYDLVADGGFGDKAELERVYESAGIIEENDLPMLNESLGLTNDNLHIYDVTEKYPELLNEDADFSIYDYSFVKKDKKTDKNENSEDIYNKNNESQMAEENKEKPVSVTEMYKYSVHVKEEMQKFEKAISEMNEKINLLTEAKSDNNSSNEQLEEANSKIAVLEEEITNLKAYSNELSKYISETINYTELIAEDHNHVANYVEMIAEDHNWVANYAEKLAEDHNWVANYAEKLAEDHNYVSAYVNETIRPLLEKNIAYAEKIAEEANHGLNYMEDVLAKELHETQSYVNDVITEKVNQLWNYQDYIAERQEEIFAYSEYLGENAATREDLENAIGYAEQIDEKVNNVDEKVTKVNENIETNKVNESAQTNETNKENILNKYTSLGNKIDNLLESIQKTKMEPVNEHFAQYPFLKDLSGDQQKRFISLEDVQKRQFESSINESERITTEELESLFEKAETIQKPDASKAWLENIPEEYVEAWEALSESAQTRIAAQAKLYPLDTPYQITNFWQTRGLNRVEKDDKNQMLNESAKQESEKRTLGYSSEYMNAIKSGLDRFNK